MYKIVTNNHYLIFALHLVDGRQLLAANYDKYVVALYFDEHGNLLEQVVTSVPYTAIEEWIKQFEFTAEYVRIKQFMLPDKAIGINNLREDYEEFLSLEEREDAQAMFTDWESSGYFILWWGNNFEVSQDGKIVAS